MPLAGYGKARQVVQRDLWKSLQRELPARGENGILFKLFLIVLAVV